MKELINKNKNYIFLIYFILTPVLVMICNIFNIPNFLAFFLPNFIMFYLSLKVIILNIGNIKKKEFILTAFFYISSLIACLFATNRLEAFIGSNYRMEGLVTYLSYLGFFYSGFKLKKKDTKKIVNLYISVVFIISLLNLTKLEIFNQMFGQTEVYYYFYTGPFSHFNHFGYYLLITNLCTIFMFLYTNKYKILYFIVNLVLLYTLVINDTFGVFVAYVITLIVLLVYYIVRKQKIKEMILLVLSLIFISIITYRDGFNIVYRNISGLYKDTSIIVNSKKEEDIFEVGTTRGKLWIYGLKFIKEKLLGYGFENIKYEYKKNDIFESKPHNLILDLSLNSGVVGMLSYVILIAILIIDAIKRLKIMHYFEIMSLAIVIAYLISSMFGNSTFYVSPYFYIFLGIMSQNYKRKLKNEV